MEKDNCIIAHKPVLKYNSDGTCRLTADIEEPGRPVFHAFIEVEQEYGKYFSVENAGGATGCYT